MKRGIKMGAFLIVCSIGMILFAIFAMKSDLDRNTSQEYIENIRALNDSIRELKKDIAKYEDEIARLDFEREQIKKEVELIIKDNEKVDTELANGDWDDNIKFLTDFLSKEDTFRERHIGGDNETPVGPDKQEP